MRELVVSGRQRLDIDSDAAITVSDGADAVIMVRPRRCIAISLSIGDGCTVDCMTIADTPSTLSQENRIGRGSVLRTTSLWLSEGRQKMVNVLSGERSEAYDMHLFIGKKGDLVIDTTLRHIAKDTKGDVLIKGVVQDGAYAGLDGIVKIEKGASGAESFIAEHVLLLSPQARARARPRLEIENNDVSSRHAASVTPIDKDKAFYLMSRGISEKDSGRLIVEGFMLSAIERMPVEAKERIGARLASELSESL